MSNLNVYQVPQNQLIDMPNEEYHSHRDHISSSQIKDLLKNPYLFFNPVEKEHKDVFDIGSAIHCLILEPQNFKRDFIVAPKIDKRTKVGKDSWIEFVKQSEGKIVLKSEDFDNCIKIQKSVLSIPEVVNLLKEGVSEKSYFTTLKNGIKAKVRPDFYRPKERVIIDIKSCRDASPDGFKRDIASYKYYIQAAYYIDVLGANEFIFLAVEKQPPYMVGIYVLTKEDLARGRELIQKAFEISKQGDKYKTPIFKDGNGGVIQTLVMPNYIHYDNEN